MYYYKGLVLVVLVAVCLPALLAKRNNKEGHGGNRPDKKHDNCTWTYGPCVFKNGASCGVGKKTGTPANEDCPVKQKLMHCKVPCSESPAGACRYKKPRSAMVSRAQCDPETNKAAVTVKLSRGDPATCPPTKVVYESCRRRQERAANKRLGEKRSGGRKQKQGETTTPLVPANVECKYRKAKGSKPVCDPATSTRTITKQLKKNGPSTCEPTKTFTEPCRPAKAKQGKNSGRKGQ